MNPILANSQQPTAKKPLPNLSLGCNGSLVAGWQIILGIEPTAQFDERTQLATKLWQTNNLLKSTGIVDADCWAVATKKKDPKKNLFVAACEVFGPTANSQQPSWQPSFRYMHAEDTRHADVSFRAAHSREIMSGLMRVLVVGPVIGFFVHDSHGEVLSV
jgi:hypothetical protein